MDKYYLMWTGDTKWMNNLFFDSSIDNIGKDLFHVHV